MSPTTYISTEQFSATVTFGENDAERAAISTAYYPHGVVEFNQCTGGDISADVQRIHPGAMRGEIIVGGRRTISEVMCNKPFYIGDSNFIHNIAPRVGRLRCTVTKQPVDPDGKATGLQAITFTGILSEVRIPEYDSESTDLSPWGVTVTPDWPIG
jgi:hypothetical protein